MSKELQRKIWEEYKAKQKPNNVIFEPDFIDDYFTGGNKTAESVQKENETVQK